MAVSSQDPGKCLNVSGFVSFSVQPISLFLQGFSVWRGKWCDCLCVLRRFVMYRILVAVPDVWIERSYGTEQGEEEPPHPPNGESLVKLIDLI